MNYETVLPADTKIDIWLAERTKGITSTDAAALLGVSPWRTPIDVWMEKRGYPSNVKETTRMRRGTKMEPVIASEYEHETGRKLVIPPKLVRSLTNPDLLASLDREREDRGGIVELKLGHDKREWGEAGTDELPPHYLMQAQHQLLVTGAELCEVVAFLPDELRIFPIEPHPELHKLIEDASKEMMELVRSGQQPPLAWANAKSVEAIAKIYGVKDTWEIDLSDDIAAIAQDYMKARAAVKAAKDEQDFHKAQLLLAMGEAGRGLCSDGTRVTRKLVKRREYSVKATEYIQIDVKGKIDIGGE